MKKTVFVYTTVPSKEDAKKIAHSLLKNGVIACANIVPITSIYRWEGDVAHEEEYGIYFKTYDDLYERIVKELEAIHPYTIPCITKINVEFNEKYYEWLAKEIEA